MRRYFVIAYVIVGLLGFLLIAAKFDLVEMEAFDTLKSTLRKGYAPALTGDRGWVNTEKPIKLSELKGKVVLLNFWTYCSINSRHAIDDIKKLEIKYKNELVVIGVHTGKFTNESELDNIRQAVFRNEIKHPVINDATFTLWHKYHVNSWPTMILIKPDGFASAYFAGEGNYNEMDKKIGETVAEYREKGTLNEQPISFGMEVNEYGNQFLLYPGKVLADEATNRLFIADTNHNRIVITDLKGEVVYIVGNGLQTRNDGSFETSGFNRPQGMVLNGNLLYVADSGNNLIREIDLEKEIVKTVAGTGERASFMEEGGIGLNVNLNSPWDLCYFNNKIYIAMAGSHQIWVMDMGSYSVAPFAGNCRLARIDGPLLSSSLAQPGGIATDGMNLYFADSETSSIRSAELKENGLVSSLIGLELFQFGDQDGLKSVAKLQHPLGVMYHNGQLYIADTFNHKIKVLDMDNYYCKTIFGNGLPGNKDGGSPQFYEPGGLSIANGKLYIADTNNHSIRVADLNSGEVSTLQIKSVLSMP